jgi:hypothetical protein
VRRLGFGVMVEGVEGLVPCGQYDPG